MVEPCQGAGLVPKPTISVRQHCLKCPSMCRMRQQVQSQPQAVWSGYFEGEVKCGLEGDRAPQAENAR